MLSPVPSDLQAFDKKLRALGESERYWRIQRLRRLWQGAYYDGRPSFWDASVPLRERAPCVQSMVCRTAGKRLTHLVFGDRAFPRLKIASQAYGVALDEASQGAMTALIEEVTRTTHLRRVMRAVLGEGLEVGTVCVLVELVEGALSMKLVPAEMCTPTFAPNGRTLESLCIERKLMHADGKLYIHKRVISPPKDCVYAPVLAEKAAHGRLQLGLGRVAVAGERLFGLTHGDLHSAQPGAGGRQQNHSGNLPQGDPGLRILLQGEYVFDHDEVGRLRREHLHQPGEDVIEPVGQTGRFGGVDTPEGVAVHGDSPPRHDPDARGRKTRVYPHDFEHPVAPDEGGQPARVAAAGRHAGVAQAPGVCRCGGSAVQRNSFSLSEAALASLVLGCLRTNSSKISRELTLSPRLWNA